MSKKWIVVVTDEELPVRSAWILQAWECYDVTVMPGKLFTPQSYAHGAQPIAFVIEMGGRMKEMIAEIRSHGNLDGVPIIVAARPNQPPSVKLEAFFGGAADFVEVDIPDGLELVGRLQHVLRQQHRIDALTALASEDPLTGILNRRASIERLNKLFAGSKPGFLSVITFDVDYFKRVNDDHGHPVGDIVLKRVIDAVSGVLRGCDALGRLGGEEFVILMARADMKAAMAAAERARVAIATTPVPVASTHLIVTASFGVSTLRMDDTPETLFARADSAMYNAKSAGRNQVFA